MKQLFTILTTILLLSSVAMAQPSNTQSTLSPTDSTYTPSYTDSTPGDTTVVSDVEEEESSSTGQTIRIDGLDSMDELINVLPSGMVVAVVAILAAFGFPILLLLIAFYFRYKSQRNRYRLVEKAIEAGQPIPEAILNKIYPLDTRAKGVRNLCTGIGLFIFLWAITTSFAIGCIGILVMCKGAAQLINARNQPPIDDKR